MYTRYHQDYGLSHKVTMLLDVIGRKLSHANTIVTKFVLTMFMLPLVHMKDLQVKPELIGQDQTSMSEIIKKTDTTIVHPLGDHQGIIEVRN